MRMVILVARHFLRASTPRKDHQNGLGAFYAAFALLGPGLFSLLSSPLLSFSFLVLFPSPMSIVRWRLVLHQPPGENPRFSPLETWSWKPPRLIRYTKPFFPASGGLSKNYARRVPPIVGAGLDPTPRRPKCCSWRPSP